MTVDPGEIFRSKTIRAGIVILAGWINQHLPSGWDISIRIGTEIFPLQDLAAMAIPVIFWGRFTAKGPLFGKEAGNVKKA